jgi:hypothetical protein
LLGGLAGLVVGGFFGALIMVVAMIFTDRAFSVLQGVGGGGAVGLLLGVRYPRRIGKALGDLLAGI